MKRKILYISMCAPFPNAGHAGGKTFNYYISKLAEDPSNEITLISKLSIDEERDLDKFNKNISPVFIKKPNSFLKKMYAYFISLFSKINPLSKYGSVIIKYYYCCYKKELLKLKQNGYDPDLIVLEWTQMLLFIDSVKKIFPNAKYAASEHDVTFLGCERKYKSCRNVLKRFYNYIYYKNALKRELKALEKCDLIFTHNNKDKKILEQNGINLMLLDSIVPYYDTFNAERNASNNDIIFYGAMNRFENHEAVVWFINNVMPRLKNLNIRFVVIGNKPSEDLKQMENDRICVTGFVEDVSEYFSKSMCMVSPLFHGAGIKVKIIEGLSSGIPILTNDIGIEGIDAERNYDYFHCDTAEEYVQVITKIYNDRTICDTIADRTGNLIRSKFDIEKSFKNYQEKIYNLIKK